MAYTVAFYNFGKKPNSTAVPSGTGTSFNCIVKTETGILSPLVQLSLTAGTTPLYNYAYISAFNRYYWINEWSFSGGLWNAELTVDPLASFKSSIGSASLYVLRSAYEKDEYVVDTHYPIKARSEFISTGPTNNTAWWSISSDLSTGYFVVGLRGRVESSQTAGGITYLVMTPAQFKTFTEDLFDDQLNNYIAGGSLDIGNALACMIFNPTQYIASCMWFPAEPINTTPSSGFNVGWWGFTSGTKILTPASQIGFSKSFSIPPHPVASTRGLYLSGEPFTERYLYLPRVGIVNLTGKISANIEGLHVYLSIDPISGQGLYTIRLSETANGTQYIIDKIQCQIGVDLPLSSNQVTIQEAAAAITDVGRAAYEASQFNGIGAMADVASAMNILSPHINDISSASGFLGLTGGQETAYPLLFTRYRVTTEDDHVEEGYPLCKIKTISNVPGYNKVLHGDLAISGATRTELDQIRDYLENGFYYE